MTTWYFFLLTCQLFSLGIQQVNPPPYGSPATPTATPSPSPTYQTPPSSPPSTPSSSHPLSPPTATATATSTSSSCPTEIILPEMSLLVKKSLTIYYEAMEEDSQVFFNTTLAKKFDAFYPYLDLNFVPCQQAQVINGELFCYNPMDPTCSLNKAHSCAIAQTENKLVLAKFLMCTMTGTAALPDYKSCASSSGLDTTKLQSCIDSSLGKQLCIDFRKQKAPECNSLPGFIFKHPKEINPATDPFDHFLNDACSADFTLAVCAVLKSSNKSTPPDCGNQKLTISVSYKIEDDNSYKWFQDMSKLYDKFSKFISIRYQPCMFAEFNNGKLDCKSPVDKDCITGKMHSCAISLVKDEAALFKFIACTTQDPKKIPDFEKCANDHQVDFKVIKACVDSNKGTHLCYASSKTRPSDKMPAVRFETKYIEAASEESLKNLQFVLCQQFRSYNLTYPEDCKGTGKLSIFYDSLDPEFQCFLSNKFMDNFQIFSSFVTFDFVPCRTAKEESGDVTCPNKLDKKCYIDKFESCTVKNFPDNYVSLKLLLCLSQSEGEAFPDHGNCVVSAKIDGAKLKSCADGEEGKKLCIENSKKSPKNDRSMAFQFNDKWDENVDKAISGDFFRGLCDSLIGSKKLLYPNECYPSPIPSPPSEK